MSLIVSQTVPAISDFAVLHVAVFLRRPKTMPESYCCVSFSDDCHCFLYLYMMLFFLYFCVEGSVASDELRSVSWLCSF